LQGELQTLYHWCVQELHGWSRVRAYAENDTEVTDEQSDLWHSVIERLAQHEPVQYVFGSADFFGLKIKVNQHTLIPRPETEELVELLLQRESATNNAVLDIGTGSGCIALAIKSRQPEWSVRGCDISEQALSVAKSNADALQLDVSFFSADAVDLSRVLDSGMLVISNPPYIPVNRKETLEKNVLDHEPHLALFSPEDQPFYFFIQIARQAWNNRVKAVYFETHATEMDDLVRVLQAEWNGSIELVSDLAGKQRFVILSRSN